MYFVVFCTDREGMAATRAAVREQHRAYLRESGHPVKVHIAGPTLTDDGAQMNGTLLVVEAADRQAVEAFLAGDPYSQSQLFASVVIRPWRWGLGAPGEVA
jgi:uncharacterized protein YciI